MASPYSTLEVRGAANYGPYDYGNMDNQVLAHNDSINPQAAPFETEGAGSYFPEVANHRKNEQPGTVTSTPANICGLPKRTFYIVLVVGLVVVIGAVVGGVVGGLTSKDDSTTKTPDESQSNGDSRPVSSSVPSSVPETGNVNVLGTSKLAASNMTGSDGNTYRTVFFQDTYNAIIARRWDSRSKAWETSNVTRIMEDQTTPLDPIAGTPLASISCDYNSKDQVHVWFITPANYISTVLLPHAKASPNGWEYDVNGSGMIETYPGSQLAASWQRCRSDNCPNGWGNWAVAYQSPGRAIKVGNSTDWQSPTEAVRASSVADNSSLGIIPQVHHKSGASHLTLVSESLRSGESGLMQQNVYMGAWYIGSNLIGNIPTPQPKLQFAITLLDDFNKPMFLVLLPNGTVSGKLVAGTYSTSIPSFNFNGGPLPSPNFTAIAATEEAMLYGISNDEVLQYELDPADPFSLKYVGRVYP
ncbi:hypothetical protein F4811DRAFT_151623 [Daldinia bambusicola]|nr:hypothetical protein F4811DRAFT_151623 [Daldinia bambusicola]